MEQLTPVRFVHLRTRVNGVAAAKGGYTIAIKPRNEGDKFAVTICQCNSGQTYDSALGEKVALGRMKRGQFFVQDRATLIDTLHTLHHKLCVGMVPRLNLDVLEGEVETQAA